MNNANDTNAEGIRTYMGHFWQAINAGDFEDARSIAHDLEEDYGIDAMDLI